MCSDFELFCAEHVVGEEGRDPDRRTGSSVLIGHSMGGVVAMSSMLRRCNEPLMHTLRMKSEAEVGEMKLTRDPRQVDRALEMARTMELVPNGKRIYDAATPGYIAAAVIVDVTPMNPTLSYPPRARCGEE